MQKKLSDKKIHITCAFIVIAAALGTFDISGYLKASQAWVKTQNIGNIANAFNQDAVAIKSCDNLFPADGKLTHEWRDCWVGVGPKLNSVEFTSVYAFRMYAWLDEHKDDVEARQAGLNAIEAGWRSYKARVPQFEARDALGAAHDRSLVLRLRDGSIGGDRMREILMTMLESAELGVRAPDVRRLQIDRRMKLAGAMPEQRQKG